MFPKIINKNQSYVTLQVFSIEVKLRIAKQRQKKICNVLFWYPKVKVPLMINHLGQPEKGWIYSSEKRIQGSLRNGNRENELQKTGLGK